MEQLEYIEQTLDDLICIAKQNDLVATNDYVIDQLNILKELLLPKQRAPEKTVNDVGGVDISEHPMQLPLVHEFRSAPAALFYFNGMGYPKGTYIKVCEGFVVKVPFPDLMCYVHAGFKKYHVECRHFTRRKCEALRKRYADAHDVEPRDCNFVHKGEQYIRVGTTDRCGLETLGHHDSLGDDISSATLADVKKLVMNATTDLMLACVWYQNKFHSGDLVLCNCSIY